MDTDIAARLARRDMKADKRLAAAAEHADLLRRVAEARLAHRTRGELPPMTFNADLLHSCPVCFAVPGQECSNRHGRGGRTPFHDRINTCDCADEARDPRPVWQCAPQSPPAWREVEADRFELGLWALMRASDIEWHLTYQGQCIEPARGRYFTSFGSAVGFVDDMILDTGE